MRMMVAYGAQIIMFAAAFLMFWYMKEPLDQFRVLGNGVIILGILGSIVFVIAVG